MRHDNGLSNAMRLTSILRAVCAGLLRVLLLASGVSAATNAAASTTVRISAVADTSVASSSPGTPFGTNTTLVTGGSAGAEWRMLMRWNIAGQIPSGSTIESVTLRLRQDGTSQTPNDLPVVLRRIVGSWTESTTWNTQPSTSSSPFGLALLPGLAAGSEWLELEDANSVLLQYVQAAVSQPPGAHGISIAPVQAENDFLRFRSREGGLAPQLVITYTEASSPPVITGMITDSSGVAVEGVRLSVTQVSTALTDSDGVYTITVPPGWSGTVRPSLDGWVFVPPGREYTNVNQSLQAEDYTAVSLPIRIAGTVVDEYGYSLAGVQVNAIPGPETVSNADGSFVLRVPTGWSGAIEAERAGYAFNLQSFSNLQEDVDTVLFVAGITNRPSLNNACSQPLDLADDIFPTSAKPNLVFITHGWNGASGSADHSWIHEMACRIKDDLARQGISHLWDVVAFDWPDFQVSLDVPSQAVCIAKEIGMEIGQRLAGRYDFIHMIAHSAGANLIEEAHHLPSQLEADVHLTTLDPYVFEVDRHDYAAATRFHDNYHAQTPVPGFGGLVNPCDNPTPGIAKVLPNAYNIDLTSRYRARYYLCDGVRVEGPSRCSIGDLFGAERHGFPWLWYLQSTPLNFMCDQSVGEGGLPRAHCADGGYLYHLSRMALGGNWEGFVDPLPRGGTSVLRCDEAQQVLSIEINSVRARAFTTNNPPGPGPGFGGMNHSGRIEFTSSATTRLGSIHIDGLPPPPALVQVPLTVSGEVQLVEGEAIGGHLSVLSTEGALVEMEFGTGGHVRFQAGQGYSIEVGEIVDASFTGDSLGGLDISGLAQSMALDGEWLLTAYGPNVMGFDTDTNIHLTISGVVAPPNEAVGPGLTCNDLLLGVTLGEVSCDSGGVLLVATPDAPTAYLDVEVTPAVESEFIELDVAFEPDGLPRNGYLVVLWDGEPIGSLNIADEFRETRRLRFPITADDGRGTHRLVIHLENHDDVLDAGVRVRTVSFGVVTAVEPEPEPVDVPVEIIGDGLTGGGVVLANSVAGVFPFGPDGVRLISHPFAPPGSAVPTTFTGADAFDYATGNPLPPGSLSESGQGPFALSSHLLDPLQDYGVNGQLHLSVSGCTLDLDDPASYSLVGSYERRTYRGGTAGVWRTDAGGAPQMLAMLENVSVDLVVDWASDAKIGLFSGELVVGPGWTPRLLDVAFFELDGAGGTTPQGSYALASVAGGAILRVFDLECLEDVDGDGIVAFGDLNRVLSEFGCTGGCSGDINGDGNVNFADLNQLLSQFGSVCP